METKSSFDVGDRVVLHSLVSAAHHNGRHGAVSRICDESDPVRYAVDLDLWDPDNPGSLAVKASNLYVEPEIPSGTVRAEVQDGILDESFGRPLSFILDSMRILCANYIFGEENIDNDMDLERLRDQGHEGLARLNSFMASAWTHFNDPGGFHTPDNMGIYELLQDFSKRRIRDAVAAECPEEEMKKIRFFDEAVNHQAGAAGWNARIHGDFWIVSGDDEGAYLVPAENIKRVYRVLGIRNALYPMISKGIGRIALTKLTMISFYGRLVYDGVVYPLHTAGTRQAAKLKRQVEHAKQAGLVVDRLRQLEVPGGSLEGLPSQGNHRPSKTNSSEDQDPPTRAERRLVQRFKAIPAAPNATKVPPDPNRCWVMRRFGYTEEENPNHIIVLMSTGGSSMEMFRTQNLEPKASEILGLMVKHSRKSRPVAVFVDDDACFHRLKFLVEKECPGTKIEYYMPPTKEETAAAMVQPNPYVGFEN